VSGTPGEVLELSAQGIVVQAKSGTIRILEIQRPGKKMLPANLYFHNPNLKDILVGEKFE
jgi:methionyl-tRNA formyltransferase